jgi:phosphoglucosamine mutase
VLVRDTRESGPMLESALAAGIAEGGGDALVCGVLPTPAASVLVRRHGLDLAGVISASHNPARDNGIKFFGPDGGKVDGGTEAAIEARVLSEPPPAQTADGRAAERAGRVRALEGAREDYLRELESAFRPDLEGVRVVLDCAHGATYRVAPAIFGRLGAEVDAIGVDPDGRNINDGVGSTHPEALAERVAGTGAQIGFAFDGDGDRVIAVDASGGVRDGDELLALIARHLQEADSLGGGVAVTVMSNYGFHNAMDDAGIEVATTPVGDRHVAAALAEREWKLGGEQSGHLIWTGFAPTGDGVAAALLSMRALGGRPLADAIPMRRLPQVLRNVTIPNREAIEGAAGVWDAVERENAALDGRGRVLVRPSGTEPLVRVMVEAPEQDECQAVCDRVVEVVRRELAPGP